MWPHPDLEALISTEICRPCFPRVQTFEVFRHRGWVLMPNGQEAPGPLKASGSISAISCRGLLFLQQRMPPMRKRDGSYRRVSFWVCALVRNALAAFRTATSKALICSPALDKFTKRLLDIDLAGTNCLSWAALGQTKTSGLLMDALGRKTKIIHSKLNW